MLPTPDETEGVSGRLRPEQAGQADRRLARAARVRRVLGAEVGRPAADSQCQGHAPRGVHKFNRWIVSARFATNMPYDQFARELLTADGSTFSNPPANYFRTATDTNDCTETTSQLFLGIRIQCAKCHNHPFERWTQDNYYGIGAFFNRVQRKAGPTPDEQVDLRGPQRRSHAAAHRQADEALAAAEGRRRSAGRGRPPPAVRRLADASPTTRSSPRSR